MTSDLAEQGWQALKADRRTEAHHLFRSALVAHPHDLTAIEGMGELAMVSGDFTAAREFLEIVLAAEPGRPETAIRLGATLLRLGLPAEAKARLETAVKMAPRHPMARYWLGETFKAQGKREAAISALWQAVSLEPNLLNRISREAYTRLLNCDWADWDETRTLLETAALSGRTLCNPLTLMMLSSSQEAIAACSEGYGKRFEPQEPVRQTAPRPAEKIRIGVISSDLNDHPISHLLAGVIEQFDRRAFHLTAYSFGWGDDSEIRRRLQTGFDRFVHLDLTDDGAVARRVAEDQIDIAVSLSGYSGSDVRPLIFAHRPAPIQVSWLGYPGSLGAPYIDYLIADRHTVPVEEEDLYREKIVRLPHSYQPTDDKAEIADGAPSRAEAGLPERAFVFMGYNRTCKTSPLIFDVWMRILRQAPASVLWMMERTQAAPTNLRREAAARGVDPDRLVFAKKLPSRPQHLARHRLADLFLDTLPYNAHSTASDALWAGLPVLTCLGSTFPGRVCGGMLEAAGFPDLIAENLEDYERRAIAFALDPGSVAELAAQVRSRAPASPLFDTPGYARAMESAFAQMYQRRLLGLGPASFDVR